MFYLIIFQGNFEKNKAISYNAEWTVPKKSMYTCTLMEYALMKCTLTSVTCEKNNKVCQLILFSMNETSKKKRIFQSLLRPIPHPTPLISTCIDEKILCRNRNYTLQYNMSWVPQKSVVSDKNFNLHILSMELMFHNSPFYNH